MQFSRLDLSDGLSHNQVNTIWKDDCGFMWFGTLSGLNRFDGYQFKVFKHDPRDPGSISDDFVTNIFELPNHKLYIETRNEPCIYDPLTERFVREVNAYLKTMHIQTKAVRGILKDNAGNFWFNAGEEGLFKYNISNRQTVHLYCDGKENTSLGKTGIASIQKDNKGNIWVIHKDKTIERLNNQSAKVEQRIGLFHQNKPGLSNDYRMFIDQKGALWVYTLNTLAGIDYYDPATGKRKFINKETGSLNNNLINCILQDPGGLIWIATDQMWD
ncbi:ligand-binding sensor domain-containing protein [Pedobacter sp. NJ-S-72]